MATSWSIEHIPSGGGASTFAPFAIWGFAALRMQFANWGVDRGSITSRGGSIAFVAAQFGYRDKLVVWRDGVRHSHWWIVGPGLNAEAQESRTYTLAGPAWWLDQTPFQHPQHIVDITTDPETGSATGCTWEMMHGTEVVWTSWPAQSSGTINGQIHRALYCAVDNDAPIAIGAIDMPGLAAPAASAGTCFSVMQQAARLLPRSACWWDCSAENPAFHASSRAGLSTYTLTIGDDMVEAFGLHPRADQRIDVVRVVYSYPAGDEFGAWFDTAGDATLKDGPNTLRAVVECSTSEIASNAASHYGIAAQLYGALSETPWEGSVIIHDTGAGLPIVPLGAKLSLAGGRSEWAAMAATITQIQIDVTASANDILSVSMGAPPALGAQDIFEALNMLLDAASGAVATTGGTTDPTPDPGDEDPTPGTYDDINGTTGGGTPEGIVAVQARGGAWSLVGHTAIDGVTDSPPRRWRRKAYSGASTDHTWNVYPTYPDHPDYYACGESTLLCTSIYALLGECVYDRDTGLPTNTLRNVLTKTGSGCGGEGTFPSSNSCEDLLPGVSPGPGTLHTTHTAQWYTLSGVCTYSYPVLTGSIVTGEIRVDLLDEDTEADAIARLWVVDPEWGAATTAIRTIPTTGITGLYRELRYRTEHTAGDPAVTSPTIVGLSPWQRYRVTVTLESRPVDSAGAPTGDGSWSAAGTRQHYFVANIDGEGGIDWQVVEPTAGYETRIVSTLVEVA